MPGRPDIALFDAGEVSEWREWIQAAYPAYLSEIAAYDPSQYTRNSQGVWEPDHLPYWFGNDFCHTFVGLAGQEPVGFAFVGRRPFPFMSAESDFRLSELYIVPPHRRNGTGQALAQAVFHLFRGTWELSVLPTNHPALAFWRRLLPTCSATPVVEQNDGSAVRFVFSTA